MYYDAKITPQFYIAETRVLTPAQRAVAVDIFMACVAARAEEAPYDEASLARLCGLSIEDIEDALTRLEDLGIVARTVKGVAFQSWKSWGAT